VDQIDRSAIIADRPAWRIAARPEGGCWYANGEGLFRFDGFETSRPVVSEGLLAATISDLAVLGECLAVATRGNGLLLLRDDGFRWQLDALSGLPSNICTDLFAQDNQTLWVASNRGIARLQIRNLNERQLAYETYDTKDGLISNEVNALAALRGSVYLGTNSGISIFNETDFKAQSVAPGIYFRGISIAERDTAVLPAYELRYAQNRISIRFSSIAFNSGNLIQYRYRLLGLDKEWIPTPYGEVRYGSLPPGEYTFEVQALNKDGLVSEETARFTLRIRRPWYQSGWFIFLVGLGLAGLIFVGYSVLIGQTERSHLQRSVSSKTAELDRKIHELRRSNDELEQFAYIASHDLKEPLRNIANYVQLLQRRLNGQLDADAQQYMQFAVTGVRRMYAMIDGLLLYSGLTKPDPSVAEVDLNALLEQTLASVTAQHRERQVVVTKAALPPAMVNRDQVGELLWQLLDNAIRFNRSEPVLIKIDLQEREDELEISIQDNGIGLEERYHDKVFQIFERLNNGVDEEGSGIGLALCKKIVERHGGRIWYRSTGRGAAFYFTLKKNLRNQTA
jgi:signal transduction histidine kinase